MFSRVYEALATGSTPVIEDVATKGHCSASPWRLLKRHDPPVIWVKTWDNLEKILAKERRCVIFLAELMSVFHTVFFQMSVETLQL